jgi:hypothetical protein
MELGTQRYSRTKMVLPLRVFLDQRIAETTPWQWAHTIDTCDVGCRIGGLRTELAPGQIITVQRGQHKAPFRVIWSRQLAPNENQAGIEVVDQKTNIWALNSLPAIEHDDSSPDVYSIPSDVAAKHPEASIAAEQTSLLAAAGRRLRLSLGLGLLVVCMAVGMFLYRQIFPEQAGIEPLLPSPPTAEELARLTPKPHFMPFWLTKPLDASISRVQVAEAPTGRVVYPIPPDETISGKVQFEIVIAANGLVKQVHLLSGKQPLAEAAAQAVRLWHYGSFQGTDQATERETSVTVSFLGGDAVSLQFPARSQSGIPPTKND